MTTLKMVASQKLLNWAESEEEIRRRLRGKQENFERIKLFGQHLKEFNRRNLPGRLKTPVAPGSRSSPLPTVLLQVLSSKKHSSTSTSSISKTRHHKSSRKKLKFTSPTSVALLHDELPIAPSFTPSNSSSSNGGQEHKFEPCLAVEVVPLVLNAKSPTTQLREKEVVHEKEIQQLQYEYTSLRRHLLYDSNVQEIARLEVALKDAQTSLRMSRTLNSSTSLEPSREIGKRCEERLTIGDAKGLCEAALRNAECVVDNQIMLQLRVKELEEMLKEFKQQHSSCSVSNPEEIAIRMRHQAVCREIERLYLESLKLDLSRQARENIRSFTIADEMLEEAAGKLEEKEAEQNIREAELVWRGSELDRERKLQLCSKERQCSNDLSCHPIVQQHHKTEMKTYTNDYHQQDNTNSLPIAINSKADPTRILEADHVRVSEDEGLNIYDIYSSMKTFDVVNNPQIKQKDNHMVEIDQNLQQHELKQDKLSIDVQTSEDDHALLQNQEEKGSIDNVIEGSDIDRDEGQLNEMYELQRLHEKELELLQAVQEAKEYRQQEQRNTIVKKKSSPLKGISRLKQRTKSPKTNTSSITLSPDKLFTSDFSPVRDKLVIRIPQVGFSPLPAQEEEGVHEEEELREYISMLSTTTTGITLTEINDSFLDTDSSMETIILSVEPEICSYVHEEVPLFDRVRNDMISKGLNGVVQAKTTRFNVFWVFIVFLITGMGLFCLTLPTKAVNDAKPLSLYSSSQRFNVNTDFLITTNKANERAALVPSHIYTTKEFSRRKNFILTITDILKSKFPKELKVSKENDKNMREMRESMLKSTVSKDTTSVMTLKPISRIHILISKLSQMLTKLMYKLRAFAYPALSHPLFIPGFLLFLHVFQINLYYTSEWSKARAIIRSLI